MRLLTAVIGAEFLVSHFPEGSGPLDRQTYRLDAVGRSNPIKSSQGLPEQFIPKSQLFEGACSTAHWDSPPMILNLHAAENHFRIISWA